MGYFMKVFLLACQITGQFLSKVTLGNHTSSFYFESLSNDYGFYQGQEFLLVYKDQANELLWSDSSNSCRYTDQGSTQIGSIANTGPCQLKVYCDTVGTVLFTLNITETNVEQFYITLKPSTFHWYVVLLDPTTGNQINSINSNTNATIKLWIVDYSDEDFQEVAGNATKPSEKSKQISESFYLLGEYPTIMVDSNVIISSTPVFDAQESTWDFHVNAQNVTGGTKLSVKGQTVSLLGRTVGNTYFNLFVEKYTDTTLPITSSSLNSNSESYFQIFPDYCSKGVGFAISSSYGDRNVLFSQNMFYSSGYQYLYTFPSIVNSIVAIVSTTNTIVVLSDNGIYYNNETNFLYSSGIPSSVSLNRLKAMDYCEQNNLGMPYSFNNVVVAWNSSLKTTSSSSTLSLYLSSDGGVEFKPIEIQLGASSSNRFISDITILPSNSSLCLIISNSGDYQVKLYNIVYNEFISGYMSSGGNWATTIRATSFPASQILIWGSKLQYSPDGGINSLSMEIDLASGEIISNVITGFEGRFALATSRNRVFVGFIGFTSLVETFSGISSIELTSFMFDLSNNLVLLTPSTNPNQLISKRVIPLNQKSINSDGLTVKCPFYKWQMSTTNFDYTLDYGDILKINGTLVSDANTLNTLSISFINQEYIDVKVIRDKPVEQLDIVSIENINLEVTPKKEGRTDITIKPAFVNAECTESQKNIVVRNACPPTRTMALYIPMAYTPAASPSPRHHIDRYGSTTYSKPYGRAAVAVTTTVSTFTPTPISNEGCQSVTFTVPKGTWWDSKRSALGTTDKTVSLDCSIYNKPISQYYSSLYRPKFAIFENEKFIKTVDVNIGIEEINNRESFIFNTTAGDAHCNIPPTSYKRNVYTDNENCFKSTTQTLTSDQQSQEYPIINSTNYNSIRWTDGIGGIYLFRATVVDPDYSFCTFTTDFAIEVVGYPSQGLWKLGMVLIFNLILLIVLMISYFTYANKQKRIRLNESIAKEKTE